MQRQVKLGNLSNSIEIQRLIDYLRDIYLKIPTITTGTAPPTITPGQIGDIFIDTTNHKVYMADGTASSTNYRILN